MKVACTMYDFVVGENFLYQNYFLGAKNLTFIVQLYLFFIYTFIYS